MVKKARKQPVARIESNYVDQYDAHMERQKKKQKRLHRRLILFSILVFLTLAGLTAYHVNQRIVLAEKKEQYEEMNEKLATLKKQEKNLNEEIQLLNDEDYVLEIARINYFYSKEGELIFKLPEEEPSY